MPQQPKWTNERTRGIAEALVKLWPPAIAQNVEPDRSIGSKLSRGSRRSATLQSEGNGTRHEKCRESNDRTPQNLPVPEPSCQMRVKNLSVRGSPNAIRARILVILGLKIAGGGHGTSCDETAAPSAAASRSRL
jgi:hypothetical protein